MVHREREGETESLESLADIIAIWRYEGRRDLTALLADAHVEFEYLHSLDSIDTESLSTRGQSVWVHSIQVRLLDSSVPTTARRRGWSGSRGQSSSRPFRTAQTTISCFVPRPSLLCML